MKLFLSILTAFFGAAMATDQEISLNVHLEGSSNDDDCSPAEKFFLTNTLMTPTAEAIVIQHGFPIYGFAEQRSHPYVAPQRRELGLVEAAKETLGIGVADQEDRELYVSYGTCLRTCPILYVSFKKIPPETSDSAH